ncbi:SDR family NAD(P)-dependent oxidoreductase [Streptomyces sp. JJ36]|uniref:SDR family NAD(P)-dependent oxidoreductase n=1 Tax=Streptomyces sp. JJ36 TaxID=2736645 RepID=UPI0023511579|nr:SDR family NAD(P)-dependent oxidoreductase [Streptomyces sp. JJ36]MCF6524503.1 SDR family NAD(P)-dependent oxidoreductase [Streptomyces sp. JJ36]
MSEILRSPGAEPALRALSGRRFATRVTAQDAAVRDHLVHETPVLPGVFHLDLVLRLVRSLGVDPAGVELRRCVFIRPLIAVGSLDRQLRVTVGEPGARGGLPVTVRSRPLVDGEVVDEEWQTNFQAEIHAAPPWQPEPVPPERLTAASGPGSLDADDLYGLARQLDIRHGPFMKVQGRVGAGADFSVADVSLDPSAAEQLGHFFVHPVFMDFSVLVPFLQFPAEVRRGVVQPFIPIYVDSFRARRPLEARTLVHAPRMDSLRLDDSTQAVVADIDLCTPDGEVAVRLSGYRAKRVRSTEDIRKHAEEGRRAAARGAPAQAPAAAPAPAAPPAQGAGTGSGEPGSPAGYPGDTGAAESPGSPGNAGAMAALVTDAVTRQLGDDTATPDPDQGFYELGLTSVDLLTIAGHLETALNTDLYPTLLFEHPTITALATHLTDEGHTPPTDPTAPATRRTTPEPTTVAGDHHGHPGAPGSPGDTGNAGAMAALVTDAVTRQLGDDTATPDPDQGFYELGLTSVDLLTIAGHLETALNTDLYPTLLFEHPTITALATHLTDEGHTPPTDPTAPATRRTTPEPAAPQSAVPGPAAAPAPAPSPATGDASPGPDPFDGPVAIVGVAGRYPGAPDPDALWEVLREGRDCLTEVPADRWDVDQWYDPEPGTPGRTYLRRGGFLPEVDRFDALFFTVPPQQAKLMDPHERQFLEVAWSALEDAGYTPESLNAAAGGRVGVFAGSMWADYHLHGLENVRDGGGEVALSWLGGIPNRVSHAFDFRGPSELVDTACSSSLTALHQACVSLRRGECRAALVGGASLSLHPYKYVRSAANGLLSRDGTSRPFGQGASGYVPSDGVGALLVRPLADAEADGDRILAVVRGSAVGHTGRTSGYTVTSPDAQSRVVEEALESSGVPAGTVTLLEAHGAATALGDRMELDALNRTFRRHTDREGFCAAGSVKANIGHTEAAAGLASLTKVLLCMRHRTLVPALPGSAPDPDLPLAGSPFRLPERAEPWTPVTDPETGAPAPLRAAVSSFGFGGANAHVVLEEYPAPPAAPGDDGTPRVVALSARTEDQLVRRAADLRDALRNAPADRPLRLADVAHTLATGRRHLAERLALVASSTGALAAALDAFATGGTPAVPAFLGTVRRRPGDTGGEPAGPARTDAEGRAEGWARGTVTALEPVPGGRRIALPTYPFGGERHRVSPSAAPHPAPRPAPAAAPAPPAAAQPPATGEPPSAGGPAGPREAGQAPEPAPVPVADLERVMLYEPGWTARHAPAPAGSLAEGPVLVLDTSEERFAALRARTAAVLVTPGDGFARLAEDRFTVRPASGEDFVRLRKALEQDGRVPGAVLHLWHLDGTDPGGRPDPDTGLLSVYLLCQSWAVGRRAPLPVVHAYHAPSESPPEAAVGGLARGLRLEQPKLPLTTVRFAAPPRDPARTAEALLAEAAAGDLEVRRTAAGEREVRGFAPVRPAVSGVPLARPGGTYLVTGGAGGIARHVVRRMARAARPDIVLCGRSPEGDAHRELLAELTALGCRAAYLRADVTREDEVRRLVSACTERFGPLTGVIHTAGVVEDGLLINKKPESVRRVLAPKLAGARNLDLATAGEPLDYLVLFSSTSSVLGSIGTTDYTAANAYLDAYSAHRAELVRRGERHGRSVTLNWPLWDEGGMRINPAVEDKVLRSTGLVPLATAHGLAALEAGLAHDGPQLAVFEGDREKVEELLGTILPARTPAAPRPAATAGDAGTAVPDAPGTAAPGPDPAGARTGPAPDEDALRAALEEMIAETVEGLLPHTAGLREELLTWTFMELGLGSVDVVTLGSRLGAVLGIEVVPTLFFRCTRVPELAAHFAAEHPGAVARWHAALAGGPERSAAPAPAPGDTGGTGGTAAAPTTATRPGPPLPEGDSTRDIAVIGLAGRFPGAPSAEALWQALLDGRDLVREVPADRWDHAQHHDPEGGAGTTECPAGGFLDDVRSFDAAFFGVPRAEAEAMDPQLRLLLEVLYEAGEDAAVLPALRGSDTGVFVGQCFRDYEGEMIARGRRSGPYDATGIATTMAANRPSYWFDLSGPSLTVDTACSSSLHAVQLAVESLRRGECSMAFAAGANLMLSPRHYLALSATGALSPSGRCHAFDAAADGYVPAEAVAAVLLKPLDRALADGDPVRAVLKGVATGHGGHAGAVTAPSPQRQTALIERAWRDAGVPAHTMGCLEAHGTGTALGDPIEVEGVRGALSGRPQDAPPVVLGTAKAHLGHAEGAAGVVGIVKAVLSMEHGTVPAMPGFTDPNPYCALDDGPLTVPRAPVPWPDRPGVPRRAGVSSFGFGGANAHVVLEQAPPRPARPEAAGSDGDALVVPFSAPTAGQLTELLRRHRAALPRHRDLAAVAATLQRGRETLRERAAAVARTVPELLSALDALLAAPLVPGAVEAAPDAPEPVVATAREWAGGATVDWDGAPGGTRAPRAGLPGLPFAGERFWLREADGPAPSGAGPAGTAPAVADGPLAGPADRERPAVPAAPTDAAHAFLAETSYDAAAIRRGLERLGAVGARLAALAVREHLGTREPLTAGQVRAALTPVEPYERYLARLADVVAAAPRPLPDPRAERELLGRELDDIVTDHPELAAHTALARTVIPHIPAVVTGRTRALDLYFGGEAGELLGRIYGGNAIADHYNALVARLADACIADRLADRPDRPVRLLEVGAGTGGTTRPVLDRIGRHGERVEYTFTDISAAYFRQARARFAEAGPRMVFTPFDLERDPAGQGLDAGAYDLVVASNVVHATADVEVSVRNLRRLLTGGGLLLLNEVTSNIDYAFLLFGMIPSWWMCRDAERLPGSPLLGPDRWQAVLARTGFGDSRVHAHDNGVPSEDDQCVLVARADAAAPATTPAAAPAAGAVPPAESAPVAEAPAAPETAPGTDPDAAVRAHLRELVAEFLAVPADTVDDATPFSGLGIDSLGTIELVRQLEEDFGKLPKVLLYEAGTVTELARELADRSPGVCARLAREAAPADAGAKGAGPTGTGHPGAPAAATAERAGGAGPRDTAPGDAGTAAVPVADAGPRDAGKTGTPPERSAAPAAAPQTASAGPAATGPLTEDPLGRAGETALHDPAAPGAPDRTAADSAPRDTVAPAPAGPAPDPVALVGMAVRLPGARTTEALWRNLLAGTDHVTEIPSDRWDWRPLFGDPHREEGRTNSRWGAFVDGVTEFDAGFFGVSPREAEVMDPQQRLMLETAWHAVEDAGHAPSSLHGSRTGVFVGATSHDYTAHLARVGRYREAYAVSGNAKTVLANRISYELGLHGPSEALDTACSSSLTALHRAVQALRDDECDTALVGGVHLLLAPDMFVALGQMGALSPDGRCHAFDRAANGFVRGEGVVAVWLKPLSRALADGDTVYALVRGSGVNHGGHAQSLPVPNPAAQAALVADVLRRSGTDPRTVGYVEAHGTGTEVGDPIELRGLRKAFAERTGVPEDRAVDAWCRVGSLKSNMGHLEAAAGLAGLAKAVLALRHGTVPPSIHVREPNPLLDLDGSPFRIADRAVDWPAPVDERGARLPRRAAVSSMGFGGSNAHVVLEEYPAHAPAEAADTAEAGPEELFVLSARSADRLDAAAGELAARLADRPAATAAEVAHTLRTGRDPLEWRLAVVARSLPELVAALRARLSGRPAPGLVTGRDGGPGTERPAEDLPGLARQWAEGRVPHEALAVLSRPGVRRTALPGYPFRPDRWWAAAEPGVPGDEVAGAPGAEPAREEPDGPPEAPGAPADGDGPGEAAADEASAELVALLDALGRGELSVDEVDLRLVRNDDGMDR